MRFAFIFLLCCCGFLGLSAQYSATDLLLKGLINNSLNPQGLQYLLRQGADPNAFYYEQAKPNFEFNYFNSVHLAAYHARLDLLPLLVEAGGSLSERLHYPKKSKSPFRARYEGYTAAFLAVQNLKGSDLTLLEFMLGEQINEQKHRLPTGENLLHAAFNNPIPNQNVLRFLLQRGVSPLVEVEKNGQRINLYSYMLSQHQLFSDSLASVLLQAGLRRLPDFDSLSFLQYAAKLGKTDAIRFAVSSQMAELSQDSHPLYGNSLNMSIYYGNFSSFYQLWILGADQQKAGSLGANALDFANKSPSAIYRRILGAERLSDQELFFFNLANSNLYNRILLDYSPFMDSSFYLRDSSLFDKKQLRGKKNLLLVGSIQLADYQNILERIKTQLWQLPSSMDFGLLGLELNPQQMNTKDYIFKNSYEPRGFELFFARYRSPLLLSSDKICGLYLLNEEMIVCAKISLEQLRTANLSLFIKAFLSL